MASFASTGEDFDRGRLAGKKDDAGIGALFADGDSGFDAVDVGHHDVGKHKLRTVPGGKVNGLGAGIGRFGDEAIAVQDLHDGVCNQDFIVDHEDARRRRRRIGTALGLGVQWWGGFSGLAEQQHGIHSDIDHLKELDGPACKKQETVKSSYARVCGYAPGVRPFNASLLENAGSVGSKKSRMGRLRKVNAKDCSRGGLGTAAEPNRAAVFFHHATGDPQTQPGTGRLLCCHKGGEKAVPNGMRDAGALVGDEHGHAAGTVPAPATAADLDAPSVVRRSIDGVDEEVGDDLPDFTLEPDDGKPRFKIEGAMEAFAVQFAFEKLNHCL